MEIPVEHPAFSGRGLRIRTAGLLKGARLVVDGEERKAKRQRYKLRDDSGREVEVRLKSNVFDPIPKVEIDGQTITLARPLTWYEYAWMGLPIVLVFAGGGLGALIGLSSLYASTRVFRGNRGPLARYGLTAGVSAAAVLGFLILAVIVQVAIKGVPK
jgi:hypothetical protein